MRDPLLEPEFPKHILNMTEREPKEQLHGQPVPNLGLFFLPGKVHNQPVVDNGKKHGEQRKFNKQEIGQEKQPNEDALVV